MQIVAYLFLLLFGVSLVFTYLSIRLDWLSVPTAAISGVVSGCVFLFLFSVFKGNTLAQAFAISLGLGLLFTATSVSIAVFFQSNRREGKKNPDA